ncbi:plasmid replication/partition related protein [Xylophilus sp. Kf1]|nr:plasmid replication/partition related protein [Xylophilus sp. Kf1]
MNIVVNEEIKAYIDPLTEDEHAALERSLLAEGCRDALVLWGDLLIDGHNRYGICVKHGLPFRTVQNTRFQNIEDVHLWMIDQHLGRRSVSDFQRGVLALRRKQIESDRKAAPAADVAAPASEDGAPWDGEGTEAVTHPVVVPVPSAPALDSRQAVAKAARLSSAQVAAIEKIQKQAAPELLAAVRSGTVSINTAAAISSLPAEEQAAAAAGGKDELRQAAKKVRDARRKPREEGADDAMANTSAAEDQAAGMVLGLRRRVEELTAENEALRAEVSELRAMIG